MSQGSTQEPSSIINPSPSKLGPKLKKYENYIPRKVQEESKINSDNHSEFQDEIDIGMTPSPANRIIFSEREKSKKFFPEPVKTGELRKLAKSRTELDLF
jgi:hypothetical protein